MSYARFMRQDLSTRLFLPAWWVGAFNWSTQQGATSEDPLQQVWQTGVSPAMSDTEFTALAMILSSLQRQILAGESETFYLAPNEHQKHAATANRGRLFTYGRMIQNLSGLRFMLADGAGGYQAMPLMSDEHWVPNENEKGLMDLKCRASAMGINLILGYTSTHLELQRRLFKQPGADTLLRAQAPLSIWKSVWQELNVTEQLLLLRLEQAMQWEACWLHFDGIFGKNLGDLLAGIEIRSGAVKAPSNLIKCRLFLERLGKKLAQHGLLKFDIDTEYLAVSSREEQGAMLMWQISNQRLQASEAEAYQTRCLQFILEEQITPHISDLYQFIAAQHDQTASIVAAVNRIWMELLGIEDELLGRIAFDAGTSNPVMALPLFLEWSIRMMPEHRFPLAEELANTELAQQCFLSEEDVASRYRRFCFLLNEVPEYRNGCQQNAMSSLSHTRALSIDEFRRYATLYNAKAAVAASETRAKDAPVKIERLPSELRVDPVTAPSVRTVEQERAQGLKKLATQELQKMREHDQGMYENLKASFFHSLESSKRKLLQDMQRRLAPEQFENHLKHSLVKYMIDNPADWTSAKAPAPVRLGAPKPIQNVSALR